MTVCLGEDGLEIDDFPKVVISEEMLRSLFHTMFLPTLDIFLNVTASVVTSFML